jgi:hypothetical protein
LTEGFGVSDLTSGLDPTYKTSSANLVRCTGEPRAFGGIAWLAQDVQTKAMWRALVAELPKRRGLYPVVIAFTAEDAEDYASAIPADLPCAIVRMDDYYAHVVAGRRLELTDADLEREISERERRYGMAVMRGMVLSDRHLGRDLMTGAPGFAESKISAARSRRSIHEACLISFRFLERLKAAFPPSICLCYAGGAGMAGRPLAALMRADGVPFRNMSFTRFGDRFYWAEDEFGFSARFKAHYEATRAPSEADIAAVSAAVGPQVLTSPEIVAQLSRNQSWVGVARKVAMVAARHGYGYWKGYAKSRRGYRLASLLASIVRARLHRGWLDKHAVSKLQAQIAGRRIVYHALQVEPELTTTLFGEFASDQYGQVREMALSLPADAVLAVKEHPWQIGSRGLAFYKRVMALPNALLVNPGYPSIDLIRRSGAVSTGSSSVAYEAAALGIPAFHVQERSLLDVVPHVVAMRKRADVEKVREALDATDAASVARRKSDGARFFAALSTFGFGVGSEGLLNRKTPPSAAETDALFADLEASLADGLGQRPPAARKATA